nr:MAG TPA: hypothetical protein [Bacteriophage sp.]
MYQSFKCTPTTKSYRHLKMPSTTAIYDYLKDSKIHDISDLGIHKKSDPYQGETIHHHYLFQVDHPAYGQSAVSIETITGENIDAKWILRTGYGVYRTTELEYTFDETYNTIKCSYENKTLFTRRIFSVDPAYRALVHLLKLTGLGIDIPTHVNLDLPKAEIKPFSEITARLKDHYACITKDERDGYLNNYLSWRDDFTMLVKTNITDDASYYDDNDYDFAILVIDPNIEGSCLMAYECWMGDNPKMIIRDSDYVITGIKDNDEVKAAMHEWSTMLKGKVKGLGFSEIISRAFISDKASDKTEKKSSKKDKEDKEATPPVETVDTEKSSDPTHAHAPAVTVSTQEESPVVTTDIDTDAPFWD